VRLGRVGDQRNREGGGLHAQLAAPRRPPRQPGRADSAILFRPGRSSVTDDVVRDR
jgi:hypothetical protein